VADEVRSGRVNAWLGASGHRDGAMISELAVRGVAVEMLAVGCFGSSLALHPKASTLHPVESRFLVLHPKASVLQDETSSLKILKSQTVSAVVD
jgi:hypothetical protein